MTSDSASRVTRSRRDLRLSIVLLVGALVVVTALDAEESPKPAAANAGPAAATAPAATAVPAESEATPAEPAAPAAGKPAPAAAPERKAGPSPGRFEPTEKVRADFDVSFPVDI